MKYFELIGLLIGAILIPGLIGIVKAKMGGRKGPVLLQPVFDIVKLLRKGSVYSTTTSWVFQLAPSVYLGTVLVACLFVPFETHGAILTFRGDFVVFSYVLALGRMMMILGALDTGSGFEGMGANRHALYGLLLEPAFFLVMGSFALYTGHLSFSEIFESIHYDARLSYLLPIIVSYILLQIAMIENSRMPVDDPKTHLELTMVHEVMVLDHSGFDLGLVKIAGAFKFAMYAGLIADFLAPSTWALWAQIGLMIGLQVVFGVLVGLLESFRARNKMARNPQFIITLTSLALLAFLAVLIIVHVQGGGTVDPSSHSAH